MKKSVHTSEYHQLRAELRRIRADAGLSQRELAASLSVPHSWVAKIENGERRIDLIEFGWFVSACGVDPVKVFEGLVRAKGRSRTAARTKEAGS